MEISAKNEYFFLILLNNGKNIEKNWFRNYVLFKHVEYILMNYTFQEEELVELLEDVATVDVKDLVVFNDDFNTFDHVINVLMKVCKHTPEQAEQCTMIIHYKGKCAVKKGTLIELKPMRTSITDSGIDAAIL